MNQVEKNIERYTKKTGQTRQDLLAGAEAFGMPFILDELLPKALEQNKKIVWADQPEKGPGAMSFTLQDL